MIVGRHPVYRHLLFKLLQSLIITTIHFAINRFA